MLACVNKECANYKQELEDGVELCPLCGTKPEQFKAKNNPTLGLVAIIAGFAGLLIMWSVEVYVGLGIGVAGVVVGFISKSKIAVILSILLLLASVGILILFVKPF